MQPMVRPELVFFRHPGLPGGDGVPPMRSYWELAWPLDPVVKQLYMGEIRRAGDVIAIPPYPPGWAPGRYLDVLPESLDGHPKGWAEVTASVTVDRGRGLDACPERLRERYLFTAIAQIAMPTNPDEYERQPSLLQQATRYWYDKELETAVAGARDRAERTRFWNILVNIPGVLAGHVRDCTLENCAVCDVVHECKEATFTS